MITEGICRWTQRIITEGICPTITPKILDFTYDIILWTQRMITEGFCQYPPKFWFSCSKYKDKFNKFKIELITVVCVI